MTCQEDTKSYLKVIPRRDGLTLLAETEETPDEYKQAVDMGFNLFQGLPLDDDIKTALVERRGRLAGYLFLAETYDKGQWSHMSKIRSVIYIDENRPPEFYLQACEWSNTFACTERCI